MKLYTVDYFKHTDVKALPQLLHFGNCIQHLFG